MPTMLWNVQDIVKEMSDVGSLLQARAGDSVSTLKVSMTRGIANKIMALRMLAAHEAIELQRALNFSQLPEDSKILLQGSIDSKLAIGADMVLAGAGKPVIKPQMLTGIINYTTALEWADLLNMEKHISVR
jgi:hypothetical protein